MCIRDRNQLFIDKTRFHIHYYLSGKDWLNAFQQAIITFSGRFSDPDIHSNPLNFTASFASYRLFDAMVSKARAWKWLYDQLHKEDLSLIHI